ncbi:hypothetical protein THTE_1044 [Thermogutta terrifontis]|uniref:Uncharacterized protein n=1 Tax=Thermogutta terrifontis TaxID=1331910 RepID=A0A286RCF3_9BACT|nr:hypothetical protein THTE_1044 [Thermogutta terrifontis]
MENGPDNIFTLSRRPPPSYTTQFGINAGPWFILTAGQAQKNGCRKEHAWQAR